MTSTADRRALVLFAALGAIWGVPYLFIKVAVEWMSPPVVVFMRTAIAAALITPIAWRRDELRPVLAHWRPLLAFAALEMAVPWLLLAHAETHLPSGLTGLLLACVPIVGALCAFSLGDRSVVHPRRVTGIAAGVCGVTLLVAADIGGTGIPWYSVVEVLAVCIGYAVAPFILTSKLRDVPALGVVSLSLSAVAIGYAPVAVVTWPEDAVPARAWAAVIALGVVCTAIAFVLFFMLIASVGPAKATLITFINPAVAIVVGAMFLDERITAATVGGFALVLAGCWLAIGHRADRSAPAVPMDDVDCADVTDVAAPIP